MEEKKKLYQKWWFWVCIVLIIMIMCISMYFTIQNFDKTIDTNNNEESELNKQEESILCVNWEDFYRLEEKDNGINITVIGVVNSIRFEELVDSKEYYRTNIELKIFDKEAYPHYITVMYNRPYNNTKILEGDTIWVYGTYQYPALINANNVEISE